MPKQVTKGNRLIPRPTKIPEAKLTDFLVRLAEYGNVSQAARDAGVGHMTVYRYRENDPEFAEAWERAAQVGARNLEDEARRRAYQGWQEPVIYQGRQATETIVDNETGEVVEERPLTIRKFSDTLLIFLLKGHFPEKYKDRSSAELSGPGGGPIEGKLKVEVEFVKPK